MAAKAQHSEDSTCFMVAAECLDQNATQEGCIPPGDWGWLTTDPSPWGRGQTVADVIHQWLSDGTATCYCDEAGWA